MEVLKSDEICFKTFKSLTSECVLKHSKASLQSLKRIKNHTQKIDFLNFLLQEASLPKTPFRCHQALARPQKGLKSENLADKICERSQTVSAYLYDGLI